MNVLMAAIYREESRNKKMLEEYSKELDSLPKGKVIPKTIKGRNYYYLYYRDGHKVVSKYIGKRGEKVSAIEERLARRRQIEGMVKKLKEERKQIKKMEERL